MSKGLVLVTGGTGFVGSHVIDQLLAAGYPVRAVVRTGKSGKIKSTYPNAKNLETVEVADIANGDYTEALKGVEYVIHVASPGFEGTAESIYAGSAEGPINLANQAIKAGVKRFIQTSSLVTLFDNTFAAAFGDKVLTENSWNPVTKDQIDFSGTNPMGNMMAYISGKSIGERALWKLADEHPEVDFTTIVPPGIYGPYIKNYPRAESRTALGTNNSVYELVTGGMQGPNTYPTIFVGQIIDVRDVAKAHVLALTAPPSSELKGRHKRFLIYAGVHTWADAAKLVAEKRPELKDRLPSADATPPNQTNAPLDLSFSKEVLGLKEYHNWEDTILGALDDTLKWEAGEKK